MEQKPGSKPVAWGIAFAYYGGKQLEILNGLRTKGKNAVFYGYVVALCCGGGKWRISCP